MIKPIQYILNLNCLSFLFLGIFVFSGCQSKDLNVNVPKSLCDTVIEIEGIYSCTGECIMNDENGNKILITVSGETDKIQRFPGASKSLYQINIVGDNNFTELEIGALKGLTLRTATAEVSDREFPVLEEYIFDTDPLCNAIGFTKIVRNPDANSFKACIIYCKKKAN